MEERAWRRGNRNIFAFSEEKRIYVTKNKFWTTPEWNISSRSFWNSKSTVIPEGNVNVMDNTRTSKVKPKFMSLSSGKINEIYASILERITSVMRSAHLKRNLLTKRLSFEGQFKKHDQFVTPKLQNWFLIGSSVISSNDENTYVIDKRVLFT